jgi:hypothetical protein
MQVWRGWRATSASAATVAPTWNDWCACQRRLLCRTQYEPGREEESSPFSNRELARLTFARWLYQRGHLDPARHDLS